MTFNREAPLALLLVLLVSAYAQTPTPPTVRHGKDICIWQGECAPSTYEKGGKFNCFYNGPPTDLVKDRANHTELYELIQETCPRYLAPGKGKVCCDKAQMHTLTVQVKQLRQLFTRCPACIRNVIDHFCSTTCDPDMSTFLGVKPSQLLYSDSKKKWYVTGCTVYMTNSYAHDLYGSCENVQYPQNSGKVVNVMCGPTPPCNASKWLNFLGDTSENKLVPYALKPHFGPDVPHPNMSALKFDFIPCNTTNDTYTCSCSDCPVECPVLPSFAGSSFPTFYVTIGIVAGGVSLTFILFLVGLIAGIICMRKKSGYTRIGAEKAYSSGQYGAVNDNDDDSPTNSIGSINADDIPVATTTQTVGEPPSGCCVTLARIGMEWDSFIKKMFYNYGKFVAEFWYLVLLFSLLIAIGLSFGLFFFKVTTDPVELWSAPDSRARLEKDYFDEHFDPFYRTEMVIITAPNESNFTHSPVGQLGGDWHFGPVFNLEVLEEVFRLQEHILNMTVEYTDSDNESTYSISLQNICLSPLAPENKNCTVLSVLNYFQNNWTNLHYTENFGETDYTKQIHTCSRDTTNPNGYFEETTMSCLGSYGGPIDPNVVLGGFVKDKSGQFDFDTATALIITIPVHNHINASQNKMAATWEAAFIEYLKGYKGQYINITFSSERSIEDEINRETETDIATIMISYVLMFAYITLFLGHIRGCATIFIDMKLMVGFLGVIMVLVAVVAAIGLLSYIGVTATLIIIEVIPFLVLAVGVDNLFILVHSYERQCRKFSKNLHEIPVKELIGRALGDVAPSLILTSFSETAAFLLGGISNMPAVRTFSFFAGTAVFFNFLLQISAFIAIMSLDARRQLANRYDILVCFKKKGKFDPTAGWDLLRLLIKKYLAKFLLSPIVRPFVVLFFGLTTTASLASVFWIGIGLDQSLALPKDSFLIKYFDNLNTYLHTGPPVYFVIKEGFDYTNETQQNLLCSGKGCNSSSLGTQIELYSREPNVTHIAEPAMMWLDTYFEWLSPGGDCCGFINNSSPLKECYNPGNSTGNVTCMQCLNSDEDRPNATEFMTYLEWFLNDNPGTVCAAGGHAAFDTAVIRNKTTHKIITSYAMTYHSICKTSADFINALRIARDLSDNLTDTLGVTVYPYSVFYVYYEQYLTTVHDMALNVGLSLGAVFMVSFFLLGFNLWAATIVLLTVSMIILHMLGFMAFLNINANAISLVNLVMAVGISVEFCSHTIRWFTYCPLPTRHDRALSALSNMGASVFSGITLTKFIGVFILAFAKSQLFQVYYFRMYMCMLLWGALIGLVFLPVLLSYVGPPYYPIQIPPPYKDSPLPRTDQTNNTATTTTTKPPHLPQQTNGHAPNHPQYTVPVTSQQVHTQYPNLPDANNYTVGDLQAREQGYPTSTRPKDGQYGNGPTERSSLLSH